MNINSAFIKSRLGVIVFAIMTILLTGFGYETNAQGPVNGGFEGKVVDSETVEPIKGVSVRFINNANGFETKKITDQNGQFRQDTLQPGIYAIKFSAEGYQSKQITQELYAAHTNAIIPNPVPLEQVKIQGKTSTQQLTTTGNLVVASLPDATITLEALDKNLIYKNKIFSDQLLIVFDQIPAQKYTVSAILEGYESLKKEVELVPNKTSTLTLNLLPNESSSRILDQAGKYYALIIGGNDYKYFPHLKTAETDAKEVDTTLRKNYGFETKLLLNAGREEIIAALSEYRQKLEQNSNLLIYYAGHGSNDVEAGEAYWIPVNAKTENPANWISADDITRSIRAIPSKHILVVSDSCYSGALARNSEIVHLVAEPTSREKFLLKESEGKSRTLLSSGGNEPVSDSGGGIHSVFAKAFIIGLIQPEKEIFTAAEFYQKFIKEPVAGKANQNPEYSVIRNSGHDSGDFIFIRKK